MEFAMAWKLSWSKEKLPTFVSRHERVAKMSSTLTEIISHLVLLIFTFTARSAATPWTAPSKLSAQFAIIMLAAAPPPFCSPRRQHRLKNRSRSWERSEIVDRLSARLGAFIWKARSFQKQSAARNARNSFGIPL